MMMKGLIVLAVIAVGSALPIDSDFDSQWDGFKTFHGKKYAVRLIDLQIACSVQCTAHVLPFACTAHVLYMHCTALALIFP